MHFISLQDHTETQLLDMFRIADAENRDRSTLRNKTAVLFFPETSIRTRLTFEKAVWELGGQAILCPSETVDKREALIDVIGYIENWADLVVIRHPEMTVIREIASCSGIPVINAMSGENHPCEILSDVYGIRKRKPDFRSSTYVFVGPRGNILQSWVNIAEVLNLKLIHVADESERLKVDAKSYALSQSLDDVLPHADILLTDPLPASCRTEEYYARFQTTKARLELLPRDALINPCPPFHRGEEIAAEVIDSDRFVGYGFKKDLLTVQSAIITYCLSR